jgi:filamentous hemagglutinin
LHQDEKTRIKQLAGNDKALEERLTRAACYEAKCWAEYPEGSAARKKAYVGIAETIILDKELAIIRKEQQSNGLFGYSLMQKAWGDFRAVPLPVIANMGKAVGGGLAVSTGATICGASGAGCVVGGPLAAFGVSEATEGMTGLYKQYQGNGASGFNPLRTGFNTLWPVWGDTAYDGLYLATSALSLQALVPSKIGVVSPSPSSIYVSDGINKTNSMFGVNVPRWQNPILNPFNNDVLFSNNTARVGLFYGIGSKALNLPADINKARSE